MPKPVVEADRSDYRSVLRMHFHDVTGVSPLFGLVPVDDGTGVEGVVLARRLGDPQDQMPDRIEATPESGGRPDGVREIVEIEPSPILAAEGAHRSPRPLQSPLDLSDAELARNLAPGGRGVAPPGFLPAERDRARVLTGVDRQLPFVAAVMASMLLGRHGLD